MTTLFNLVSSCSPRCEVSPTCRIWDSSHSRTCYRFNLPARSYLACKHSISTRAKHGSACIRAAMTQEIAAEHSISGTMKALREANRGAFIPFIMAGDPDLDTTEKALLALDEEGADVIELGIPYSDPLADGPTIQAAHSKGLETGTNSEKVLELVRRVSPRLKAPIVLFQYYNPILRKGTEEYCRKAKDCGAAGVLVPDLSLEETNVMQEATKKAGLELVQLVTPTTPQSRMKKIAEAAKGFVYLVSVTGVTGGRESNQARVQDLIRQLREVTDESKSIAVGFGVSGPAQAEELRRWGAQGVIVGSALVKILGQASSQEEGLKKLRSLASSLRAAI